MKNLMTTTALVLATTLPVAAKDAAPKNLFTPYYDGSETKADMLASDLIGMRVYATEKEFETQSMAEAAGEWDDIGEVSDVVMSRDGKTESLLLDIGGFLGIGEKTVAVTFHELTFKSDSSVSGDFFIVLNAGKDMMESAQPFNFEQVGAWTSEKWHDAKAETAEVADKLQNSANASAEYLDEKVTRASDAMQGTAATLTAPSIEREGYKRIETSDMTSEMLTGAPVYDTNDNWIGEVSDLILDDQGQVTQAVLDVGGFLGIGEKSVATVLESLTIKRATDKSDLRVYVDATKEQLKEMPTYTDS